MTHPSTTTLLTLALGALAVSGCLRTTPAPNNAEKEPTNTATSAAQATTAAPAPTTTPSPAANAPTVSNSGCRRVGWAGAAPDGKGYTYTKVQMEMREDNKQLVLTWPNGQMRLVRTPKDVRAFAGPMTSTTLGDGKARINFKEPYTVGSGFRIKDGDPARRRITIEPCPP